MAGAYSTDLREQVPAAMEASATPEAAARRFAVPRLPTAGRGSPARPGPEQPSRTARMPPRRAAWPVDAGAGGRPVFLGERGVPTGTTRMHGRGSRGEQACGKVPCGRWTRPTRPGPVDREGIPAAMSVETAASGTVFHANLERVLLPRPRRSKPDAVLVRHDPGVQKTPRAGL